MLLYHIYCLDPLQVNDIPESNIWILQVNQGISVYGNKGSTDQHA